MLFISDIPCKSHNSWSCQEGRDNHLCAPLLPPKQNVSKIGSTEVPIAFETCFEMLVRVKEMTLEMASCYCTYLVCRQIPPWVISAGLADKNKPALSSQHASACREPVLAGLPYPSALDAQLGAPGLLHPHEGTDISLLCCSTRTTPWLLPRALQLPARCPAQREPSHQGRVPGDFMYHQTWHYGCCKATTWGKGRTVFGAGCVGGGNLLIARIGLEQWNLRGGVALQVLQCGVALWTTVSHNAFHQQRTRVGWEVT